MEKMETNQNKFHIMNETVKNHKIYQKKLRQIGIGQDKNYFQKNNNRRF